MKFTDRFIKFPIKIYNKETANLVGKAEYVDSFAKVLPFEISDYKQTFDEENGNVECVSLTLKNGSNFYVYLSYDEFENKLNEHQRIL